MGPASSSPDSPERDDEGGLDSGSEFVPFIGYHHVLMICLVIGITTFSIVLAGCTSTSLSNVYLLSLSYIDNAQRPDPDPIQVRVGYMGLCISQNAGNWVCSNSGAALARLFKIAQERGNEESFIGGDPLNLIWMAGKFKDEIVFNGLIFTALPLEFICLLLLVTFPGWHEEVDDVDLGREIRPFPSRPVSQVVLVVSALATVFMFISTFWQHITSGAASSIVRSLSYSTVNGHVGPAAMTLAWIGVGFATTAMIGMIIIFRSIKALSPIR
ncbi:Ca2+ regulator and membrane fusion protein Fig1-domain-containing protein [Bisporella sp. PMI_857]|nr:Ca2+ regulator and membrane fusion protein Fig1-domain-containing protein [Bisporella sp. PMI_857]